MENFKPVAGVCYNVCPQAPKYRTEVEVVVKPEIKVPIWKEVPRKVITKPAALIPESTWNEQTGKLEVCYKATEEESDTFTFLEIVDYEVIQEREEF